MNIHLRDGSTTEDTRLGRLVEACFFKAIKEKR